MHSARRPGFAQELGRLLNELRSISSRPPNSVASPNARTCAANSRDKLHDLALLLDTYADWLDAHGLQDGNHLLETAIDALRNQFKIQNSKLRIQEFVARRFCRDDAAGTGFARGDHPVLRARHARFLPGRIRLQNRKNFLALDLVRSSANPFNNAASGWKICRMRRLTSNHSSAIRCKSRFAKSPELATP